MYRIQVTDHAIVRYMERILGLDLNEIREAIIPSGKLPFKNGNYKTKDGFIVLIQNKKAITIKHKAVSRSVYNAYNR